MELLAWPRSHGAALADIPCSGGLPTPYDGPPKAETEAAPILMTVPFFFFLLLLFMAEDVLLLLSSMPLEFTELTSSTVSVLIFLEC